MTTFVAFNPSPSANFQFNPVLDGTTYTAICTWNGYGNRYYINIYDAFKTLILSIPIIASPDNYDINLVKNYFFTSTLVYRASSGNFEVTP